MDRETSQLSVLEEYINGVEMVGEEEIKNAVKEILDMRTIEKLPITKAHVLKTLNGPDGAFGGRIVEMGKVAEIVE